MRSDELPDEGRKRVVIENVKPEIDCGHHPIKRTVGDRVIVEADIFCDGHDALRCLLLYRQAGTANWLSAEMTPLANDRWQASFHVTALGNWEYTIEAQVDPYATWRRDLRKRQDAGQELDLPLRIGAEHLHDAANRAREGDAKRLREVAELLEDSREAEEIRCAAGLDDAIFEIERRYPNPNFATRYAHVLCVNVERERARFSSWYEFFPRSTSDRFGDHGTFRTAAKRLPYVADMGFDVVYLPPIHPIGRVNRKGRNNALTAGENEPGSPWAIGSNEGGHKAIHPQLGSMADFEDFIAQCRRLGLEVALDVAFQCAPDHPYVKAHPEWFRRRPDGSIQFAENPPKRYEDIYPFDFESESWRELWHELLSVLIFWAEKGVRIFRVDNPHTKALPFWEWAIANAKREYPDLVFLSEAFTRPKLMYYLAKIGFSQSYNYFPWRNHKWELEEYFHELTHTQVREYFRPNLWPNTPDILTEHLQHGGRSAFVSRLILAATLGASYGIYGPAYELGEHRPRHAGSEEYWDSEKYQVRYWHLDRDDSLAELIGIVNRARKTNAALQFDNRLVFHRIDNADLLCYSKTTEDMENVILCVVNLNPHHKHAGWVNLNMEALGLHEDEAYQVHDLVGGARYQWRGAHNYVELDPHVLPAHVFRIERSKHEEHDFDYF